MMSQKFQLLSDRANTNKIDKFSDKKMFQQFGFSTLSPQTNRQVE